MFTPTNPIAETVDKLREDIASFMVQEEHLKELREKSEATVEQLLPLATWDEVPDEVDPNLPQ